VSLLTILRSGVKTINKVTRKGGLQGVVMYARKTGNGTYGPTFAAAVPLHALVEYKSVQVKTPSGTIAVTRAVLTLLDVAEIFVATSGQGIGDDDVFTLPDGTTGPILDLGGFLDAGTGHPIETEVMLG
jgi:hypothetical protein